MNTYSKYCPNVFCAKCTEKHDKGETIAIETKFGKEHECIVFNLLYEKYGFFYYSIVRADGFNYQEFAKKKAERFHNWASIAEKKSEQAFKTSCSITDNIPLVQPILSGHHSEKRHRRDLEKAWNAMDKSVELSNKASAHESKSEYWGKRANTINLSMPESVEYYEHRLQELKEEHQKIKDNPDLRQHSFSLTYAKKAVNEHQKLFEIAKKLWA